MKTQNTVCLLETIQEFFVRHMFCLYLDVSKKLQMVVKCARQNFLKPFKKVNYLHISPKRVIEITMYVLLNCILQLVVVLVTFFSLGRGVPHWQL